MSYENGYEKDTAPLERAAPPSGGFIDKRKVGIIAVGILAIGGLAAWGFSIRGEDVADIKVSDVQPANIDVTNARPPDYKPPPPPPDDPPPPNDGGQQNNTGNTNASSAAPPKRKGPPEGFKKVLPVVMRGNSGAAGQQAVQHAQASPQGGQQRMAQGGGSVGGAGGYPGQEGYGGSAYDEDGYGDRGMRGGGRRSNKESFYAGGGGANAGDLDIAGGLLPEAQGCVVKAGTYITLQTRSAVRTTLPQRVLGYVVNPVEGNHYLGNGQVERCLAIPAMSTVLSEINASGVERGDLRIQACALRIDLQGGGRRPLGCQPVHGADGGAGMEAETDYAVSGIATGILIEAALASARGLTGLIGGPAGVAVQVGGGIMADVGSEYVRTELMRPPVLTMNAGAIYGVQLNGDLAFPID